MIQKIAKRAKMGALFVVLMTGATATSACEGDDSGNGAAGAGGSASTTLSTTSSSGSSTTGTGGVVPCNQIGLTCSASSDCCDGDVNGLFQCTEAICCNTQVGGQCPGTFECCGPDTSVCCGGVCCGNVPKGSDPMGQVAQRCVDPVGCCNGTGAACTKLGSGEECCPGSYCADFGFLACN